MGGFILGIMLMVLHSFAAADGIQHIMEGYTKTSDFVATVFFCGMVFFGAVIAGVSIVMSTMKD